MLAWALNLGFAGGDNPPDFDQNTIVINAENDALFVYGDDDMECVYSTENGVKKQVLDWSPWLGDSTISAITYSSLPASDITFGNSSNTNQTSTTYLSGGTLNEEYLITAKCVTADAIARTEERSFMLNIVRKWA